MTFSLDRLVHEPSAFDGASIVVVLAHPDDEVLGCGILLSRHANARVIHVTDGAPRDGVDAARLGFPSTIAYAAARRAELETAMRLAGLSPAQLQTLAIADQGVAAVMATVARRLVPLLRDAAVVLTHAYEGGHTDHDATAFAVHRAVDRLDAPRPVLVEMPFYRASADDWLRQCFAPEPEAGPEIRLDLTDDERRLKQRMYEAHASQAGVLAGFPIGHEAFRLAPPYGFGTLPNAGLVLYERYGWGLTGARWLAQVEAADAALAVEPWA